MIAKNKNGQLPINILVYFCVALALFSAVALLTNNKITTISSDAELAGADFSTDIVRVNADCFDWYPDQLYVPDDFAGAGVDVAPQTEIRSSHSYGTYQAVLPLTPGKVYGLSAYSATYAMTLWVDGALLATVGEPGEDLESSSPKTNHFTVYFTPQTARTEIVVQRSDFVHAQGGQLYPLFVGEQDKITLMDQRTSLRGGIVVGNMLLAALFFFGIFLFFRNRKHFLFFSLSCLLLAVRTLFTSDKLIMLLLPNMNWFLSHKIEYMATIGFFIVFILYIDRMFDKRIPRLPVRIAVTLGVVELLLFLATPSTFYSLFMPWPTIADFIFVVVLFFFAGLAAFRGPREVRSEYVLLLAGALGFAVCAIMDLLRYMRYDDLNLIQVGMMIFVVANSLALTFNFKRMETEAEVVRRRERELTEKTNMLDSLNRMKTEFLATMSHEMQTPLTVISVDAQAANEILSEEQGSLEARELLGRMQNEAMRLGRMVRSTLELTAMREQAQSMAKLDFSALLKNSAESCRVLIEKQSNTLAVDVPIDLPPVYGDADLLAQVTQNILANASRYTKNGQVSVTATASDSGVKVVFADTGAGILPELLPHVCERGVSSDGTGYGLYLCKTVTDAHGGDIQIESEPSKGTAVTLTFPLYEGQLGGKSDER